MMMRTLEPQVEDVFFLFIFYYFSFSFVLLSISRPGDVTRLELSIFVFGRIDVKPGKTR